MALAPFPGFLGPSYTLASLNAACQRTVNLYPEVIETGTEKSIGLFKGSPGLDAPTWTLPTNPVRGLWAGGAPLSNVGRLFAAAGSRLYEVFLGGGIGTVTTVGTAVTWVSGSTFGPSLAGHAVTINGSNYTVASVPGMFSLILTTSAGTQATPVAWSSGSSYYTDRGDIGNDASNSPVQMFPNGEQLFIVSAGFAYLDDGTGPVKPTFAGSTYTDLAIDGASNTKIRSVATPFVQADVGSTLVVTGGTGFTVQSITIVSVTDAAPGTSYTDLVIDATDPTKITSAANPFTSADVGTTLTVTGGTGFTLQAVTILSVTTGVATTSHNMGTLSSTAGTADQTLQSYAIASAAVGTVGSTGGQAAQNFGPVTATTGTFLDTFFIVNKPSTKQFYISASDDGTSWDPGDTATKESYPDNIGTVYADHEELYLLGESKSEVWRGPGSDPTFPFQRDPSACMSQGIAAPWSVAGFIDGVAWVGGSLRGKPVAYYATGYQPERVSTHAIEQIWAKFATVADAIGFSYEIDGHEFWQICFPTADQCWIYDRTASVQFGKPIWQERISYDGSAFHRHRANCHAYVFDKHWVGDFATGAIYAMDVEAYTDNGQPITCIRTLPHLNQQRIRQFFTKFQLDLETGGGAAFTVLLEWSDDGGHTFVGGDDAFTWTTSTSVTMERVVFWQLGSSDDRVFRITVTGAARKALTNAYLDIIGGTG